MFVNRQESSKSKYDPDPASMIRLTFDHQNPKHKFCCETLHAKYGCFFVSVAELLFTICLFINELIKYCTHDGGKNAKIYQEDTIIDDFDDLLYDHSPVPMILYGVLWIITIIFVICLLIGTFLKREKLIFAHMVFQVFRIISLVITNIILIFGLADKVTRNSSEEDKAYFLIYIFLCIFFMAVEIWLFTIVLAFYRFVVDRANFEKSCDNENSV